jgi:hypothetical protein
MHGFTWDFIGLWLFNTNDSFYVDKFESDKLNDKKIVLNIYCRTYFIVGIKKFVNKFQLYPCRVKFQSFFLNFYERVLCDNPSNFDVFVINQNWLVFRNLDDNFYTSYDRHLKPTMWSNSNMTFCKYSTTNICSHHENKNWYLMKKINKLWMCSIFSIKNEKFDVHPCEIMWTWVKENHD